MRHMRRFVVYLCLAVILLAAFTHCTNLPFVFLAAFWIVVSLAVNPPLPNTEECWAIDPSPVLPVCSPRPPPIP